jgi:phosphoesterase RecJ-like protein
MSVFISDKNGEVRMSFRSKGKIPVHEIAMKHFKGGGHVNAAGGISDLSVEDTVKRLKEILPEYRSFLC